MAVITQHKLTSPVKNVGIVKNFQLKANNPFSVLNVYGLFFRF